MGSGGLKPLVRPRNLENFPRKIREGTFDSNESADHGTRSLDQTSHGTTP